MYVKGLMAEEPLGVLRKLLPSALVPLPPRCEELPAPGRPEVSRLGNQVVGGGAAGAGQFFCTGPQQAPQRRVGSLVLTLLDFQIFLLCPAP